MKNLKRVLLYGALALAALTFIYPFLWMASATFKPLTEVGTLALFPSHPTFDNYRTMWARAPFGRALLNSMFVAGTITISVLVFGSITAYAMARLRFRGSPWLNAATMGVLLVPGQLTLIPLYTLIVQLGATSRCSLYQSISAFVELSCDPVGCSALVNSGVIRFASALPSSTPH